MVETVPPGSSFDTATPTGVIDNDLTLGVNSTSLLAFFPPGEDEISVPVTIFDDTIPENTEAAQLTLEIPTEEFQLGVAPPRFEILPKFPTFFVIIPDDDRKLC